MEIKEIKELIKELERSSITSISVQDKNGSVELKKEAVLTQAVVAPAPSISQAPIEHKEREGHFVKSPIVGMAYRSPKPGADAFVQIGQEVKVGQSLCLIEAMKMFNEIKADINGIVSEILFEDGNLVEYDMPLFKIEKS